jgi:hypothetical protein
VPSFYRWRGGVYSLEYFLDPLTWKVHTTSALNLPPSPPEPSLERRFEMTCEVWGQWQCGRTPNGAFGPHLRPAHSLGLLENDGSSVPVKCVALGVRPHPYLALSAWFLSGGSLDDPRVSPSGFFAQILWVGWVSFFISLRKAALCFVGMRLLVYFPCIRVYVLQNDILQIHVELGQ